MKKLIAQLLIIMFLAVTLTGCGDPKVIKGKEVPTYGMFNQEKKYDDVEYQVIVGNVIWGIILCETIIGPVYFFGFSLYEPIGIENNEAKTVNSEKSTISQAD